MDRIGYEPETTVPFLGDAYFENQLIDTQLRQLVGEGLGRSTFIAGDSAIKQMKTLLDNGADYATKHHLAVGQGLTPEQAAALTDSIVLYQWQTVNGVQVLAPVVYVAAADRQKLSGAGAAMAGGSVDLNVGNLDNSGLIASNGRLTVSGSSIQGSGTFLSRGDTALNATNGITLAAQTMTIGGQNVVNTNAGVTAGGALQLGGGSGDLALTGVKVNAAGNATLSGKNVTLAAAKVENDGQPAMTAGGHAENATGSQIASGKALTIKATDNVNVIGSSAKAGTTLDVTAEKGSVAVVSTDVARNNQSGYTRTLSTDQQQSQLSAGTNATIKAADDILLSGSSVKAGSNVALTAGDDINITAAQEHSASTFGKKSASSITHVGSEISAGGDLSVTAGNGSGDHDLNIVGSRLAADGKVALKADGNVTIAEATDTATLDTRLSTKGGFLGKSEKTTTHLETTTAVSSAITGGAGIDISSGKDTVISASKIEAGKEGGAPANLNITTGGDLVIASGKDTSAKDDKGARSGFLSKGSTSYKSYDETTVASELGASGNISLDAGGAAVIAGSQAYADGSISVKGDSVSVIGAAEQHELEVTRKKSGLFVGSGDGFISLWGKEQKSGKQASELNVASVLSAGTDVALKSRDTDVNILGSQIYATDNITLDAARDVNITPGAESASSEEKEKRSGFGISCGSSSGGFSVGIGMSSVSDTTKQGSQTNAMAILSAGNDLTIKAGRDANLQAADISADRDVAITAERDVNLLSAEEKSNYESVHEQFFAGVTLSVSTGLVSAGQSIAGAAQKIAGISDGYTAANAAFASLKAYDALQQLSSIAKDGGNFASVSLTAGFNYEKSSASASTSTPVVTSVEAGRSVTIEATSGDLTGHGAQITAGYDYGVAAVVGDEKIGDITLKAGHDIKLESAQATGETGSDSKSANASFGVSAGIGLQGVGVSVTGGASAGMSKSDATSITQVNSHVTGSGDITISSGNDTTLKGAVVSGDTITADVRGDLSIISTPDVGSSANSSASAGFSLTGTVGSSFLPVTTQLSGLQFGGGLGSGATNWISEQSGLLSTGKMDIEVHGNTDLQAGKIISESGDLTLSTDTLTYSDFLGQKGYEGFSAQIGIEIPGNELPGAPPANNTLEGSYQLDDTRQAVRATVGPGSITVRNEEKQAALEQSAATAPLTDLNRDPGKAYEITRDEHIDLEIYLSTRSVNAVAEGIKNAFAPGGFMDQYLLGKRLTPGEIVDVKAGVDALVNGGEFVGCGQKQGFNLLNLFFTPAYADGYLTDCTIRQKNGEFIHLGIETYQACQDAIYAYLNSLGAEERLSVLKAAAFAFVVDHPKDMDSQLKNSWLLDAINRLDGGGSRGAAYQAYLEVKRDAALIGEQLQGEQWAIWNDPSTTLSEKFQRLEDTGLDMNAVIAMAIAGGVIGSPALIGNPYHPQAVNNRIRPPYKANAAHDVNSPLYNPSKTPEPSDAQFAYENSTLVRADFGTWYARGDGGYYRYFSDNAGTAHFSGTISASQVPNSVRKILGE